MGKYIHKFSTQQDFDAAYNGAEYTEPWLSCISENGKIGYNKHDPFNGHPYVDLGLPSGTLWCTYNLGSLESEYGWPNYYRWGEIEPFNQYFDENNSYKWGNWIQEDGYGYYDYQSTKYTLEGKSVLDLEDDVAHVIMGGDWHIPTLAQAQELFNYTTQTIPGSYDGVLFTAQNGNSILLPFDGTKSAPESVGWQGYLWINSLSSLYEYSSDSSFAACIEFDNSNRNSISEGDRTNSYPIRAVIG